MRGSGTFKPSTIASRRGPLDWMIRPHMPDIYAIAHRDQLTGCGVLPTNPRIVRNCRTCEPGGHGSRLAAAEPAPGPIRGSFGRDDLTTHLPKKFAAGSELSDRSRIAPSPGASAPLPRRPASTLRAPPH